MELVTILFIAVGLAMDAFTVSLCVATAGEICNTRGKVRLAAHFGIFQGGMVALGWLAGATIVNFVAEFDHWIAMILLGYVGISLIRSGFDPEARAFKQDPSKGKMLVILSVATSIDAFAVGLSIAMIQVSVLVSVIIVGLVAMLLSLVGLFAGTRLSTAFGKRMEVLGGLILLGIGIRVVITHLLA